MTGRGLAPVCAIAVLAISSCAPAPHEEPSIAKVEDRPDQVATRVTQRITRDGQLRAEIYAERMLKFDRNRVSRLEGGIRVRFFAGHGREVSVLTAGEGQVDESERALTAIGNVVLVNRDDIRLATDTLRWNEDEDRVYGPGRVTITRAEGTETGVGFEADSDLSTWTLEEVVTRLAPSDSLP